MKQSRFYFLDILRGLAALAVVFYHWRHFSYVGISNEFVKTSEFPFYSLFGIFYDYGFLSVYLFFILSGFIFFFLYYDKIKEKSISFWNFSVLRISRLYPIHIITLLSVLILQNTLYKIYKTYLVYPENDLYHFILNILFIQSLGFEKGFSFDYPSWSVSVEIFVYILFFITCILISKKYITLIFMIFLGLFVMRTNAQIGMGILYFFIGGIIYEIYLKLYKLKEIYSIINIKNIVKFVLVSTVVISVVVYYAIFDNYFLFYGIIFGTLILSLVLIQSRLKYNEKYIPKLGIFFNSISYSSYLIHFPLQLIFIIIFGMNSEIFNREYILFLFFGILIILSTLSYRFYETPIQNIIRNKFLK